MPQPNVKQAAKPVPAKAPVAEAPRTRVRRNENTILVGGESGQSRVRISRSLNHPYVVACQMTLPKEDGTLERQTLRETQHADLGAAQDAVAKIVKGLTAQGWTVKTKNNRGRQGKMFTLDNIPAPI